MGDPVGFTDEPQPVEDTGALVATVFMVGLHLLLTYGLPWMQRVLDFR